MRNRELWRRRAHGARLSGQKLTTGQKIGRPETCSRLRLRRTLHAKRSGPVTAASSDGQFLSQARADRPSDLRHPIAATLCASKQLPSDRGTAGDRGTRACPWRSARRRSIDVTQTVSPEARLRTSYRSQRLARPCGRNLGVSRRTIYNRIREGRLQTIAPSADRSACCSTRCQDAHAAAEHERPRSLARGLVTRPAGRPRFARPPGPAANKTGDAMAAFSHRAIVGCVALVRSRVASAAPALPRIARGSALISRITRRRVAGDRRHRARRPGDGGRTGRALQRGGEAVSDERRGAAGHGRPARGAARRSAWIICRATSRFRSARPT